MENHVNARLARAVLPQLVSSTRGNIVFLLLSFPLGLISFLIAVIGLSVGLGTLVIWIGLPILFATLLSSAAWRKWSDAWRAACYVNPCLTGCRHRLRPPQAFCTALDAC